MTSIYESGFAKGVSSYTYVLFKACFVQVGCAFHFAKVVARVFGVLVDLKRSLTTLRHLSAHERSCVLLELRALRLHLKLIISVKGRLVLFKDARLCIDGWARVLARSPSGCDFKAPCWSLASEEDCLVGLEGGTLGTHLCFLTEKGCVVFLETLALHVGWHDAFLHVLELVPDSVTWVDLALVTSVEELACGSLVLGCGVADFVLEELLLCLFECWVVTDVRRHIGHRVLSLALLSAGLLELRVAQFLHGCVVLTPVELGVGLHHWLLLVLWHVSQARIVCYDRVVCA